MKDEISVLRIGELVSCYVPCQAKLELVLMEAGEENLLVLDSHG